MKTFYRYIRFEKNIPETERKTDIWSCVNNNSNTEIGEVRWYAPWRQYCFMPGNNTVFNVGCMNDIVHFISQLMDERRK